MSEKTINFEKMAEEAWDEAALLHREIKHDDWKILLQKKDTLPIDEILKNKLISLGLKGASIAQLSCNNGRELLSVKMFGANRCVGFDISTNVLKEAVDLAKASGLKCEFIKADAQFLPVGYENYFDIVFVTAGALCFIPNLNLYISQIKKILKKDGVAVIYESHPVLNIFKMDRDRDGSAYIEYDYFNNKPMLHVTGIDYYNNTTYKAKEVYYFNYTLDDILNTIISTGLKLIEFKELQYDPSLAFGIKSFPLGKPPMGLLLTIGR
ncbi:class I SAM-dependent methyltransferase [Brenneria corticis]|nr:class I SAM-dependent methyltransferase [Brenneria sp. CFCC 11842]